MTDKTYIYRLVVHGKIAYESTIDRQNPKDALIWGFYWMDNNYIKCDKSEPIHAEIKLDKGKQDRGWTSYQNDIMCEASHIWRFDKDDLRSMVAGQDLVWKIVDDFGEDAVGRLFSKRKYAEEYIDEHQRFDWYPWHIWVDGWYDEQDSWKATCVKGYALRNIWEDEE